MRNGNLKQVATWLSACLLAIFVLAGCGTKTMPEKDIVDTAVAAGDFNTLVAAVKAAGECIRIIVTYYRSNRYPVKINMGG